MVTLARQQRGRVGHAALIKAALAVFSRKGFENTSVEEICTAAGYSKGGFYFHFRSKEDLLFQMLGSSIETGGSRLDALALELWAAAGHNDFLRVVLAKRYEPRRQRLTEGLSAGRADMRLLSPAFAELLLMLEDGLGVQQHFFPSHEATLFVNSLIEELSGSAAEASTLRRRAVS
jgi:AcrR family transcriptional regulator